MTTRGYADLGDEEQVEALRPVALAAAAAFGLEPHRLEVVTHSYNTTFALDTPDGQRWALRVNTNSTSTVEEVLAQQAWQLAIAAGTPVLVPLPRRTTDGGWCAVVPSDALAREVVVTCASWLEGPDVGRPPAEVSRELGRAMAHLHRHARTWTLPEGGTMPVFDEPLFGDPVRFTTAAGLSAEQHAVLRQAHERMTQAFARVHSAGPVVALHADLHGANLKWHDGRLAVFDFDDCGFGTPALDLAISTFYLRSGDEAAERALGEGYAEVAPLPEVDPDDFEALVASRQLLLGNDLLGSTTAMWRDQAATYLVTTVDRLRHWLVTGRFTTSPPPTEG